MHEIIADSSFDGITSGVRFVPSEEKMRICSVFGILMGPRITSGWQATSS